MHKWTVAGLLRHMRSTLTNAGLEAADLDARFLLQFALKMTYVQLLRSSTDPVAAPQAEYALALLARREWREPLAHILGTVDFMGREFYSTKDALVPRKETELLVEAALTRLPEQGAALDLACGSGCIGISIAMERPHLTVHLSDVSVQALDLAKRNCAKLGARAEFFLGSWFEPLPARQKYSAILINPPYIFPDEQDTLDPEVLADPHEALFHPDPITLYWTLFGEGTQRLLPGGFILAETSPRIAAKFKDKFTILKDYGGLDRFLLLETG